MRRGRGKEMIMLRKILYVLLACALMLIGAGCGRAAAPMELPAAEEAVYSEDVDGIQGAAPEAPREPSSGAANYAAVERLIIRNAWLDIVVPDTETVLDEVNDLVDELGGYVVESSVSQYQEGLRATVRFRVPAESLDAALDRIRELATDVRGENISGQDVTEEYVDLKSRLRYLEATEERLLEFLEQAEDTEAALAVYEQLQGIQADIEQVKGRMQYLEQSAAMATVSLDITPDELAQPIQVGGWHPEGTARDALQSLIHVLQFLVDAAIVIFILVIPTLIVIAIPIVGLFFLIRAIVRRRRARKAE
jgi:hypothetical protein